MPTNAINDTGVKYVYDKLDAKKVDKEVGKGLSTNDYTTAEKNKVSTIDNKADKVSSATNGNLAGLNASGNPTDSGISGDMTTTSATGNPISIADLKSAQIALNPVITFEPIQAGSGTPSPSNIRAISGYDKIEVSSCGKNIWDGTLQNAYLENGTTYKTDSSCRLAIVRVKASTYYTVYKNGGSRFSIAESPEYPVVNGVYTSLYNGGAITTGTQTVQTSASAKYLLIYCTNDNTNNIQIQVEEGQTATTYQAPVKTTDLSESLGQTVYGGTYNPRTGKFTVTHKEVDLSTLSWTFYSNEPPRYASAAISDIKIPSSNSAVPVAYCSKFEVAAYNSFTTGRIVVGQGKGLVVGDSNSPTGQFIYELATPFTIQLTPHEIALSQGYNYISTNGTSINLAYHNGEVATHADVEQLAETVNELEDKVSANDAGTQVNLMTYNTSTNKYVCPSDGYITLSNAGASVGDYIIMSVYGANDNLICGLRCDTSVASIVTVQNLFVKRGMKCYVRATSSTGSFTALFTPLA